MCILQQRCRDVACILIACALQVAVAKAQDSWPPRELKFGNPPIYLIAASQSKEGQNQPQIGQYEITQSQFFSIVGNLDRLEAAQKRAYFPSFEAGKAVESEKSNYESMLNSHGEPGKGRFYSPDSLRPIFGVIPSEAETFCQRLTAKLNETPDYPYTIVVRLPTRAEWRTVARAGAPASSPFGWINGSCHPKWDPAVGNKLAIDLQAELSRSSNTDKKAIVASEEIKLKANSVLNTEFDFTNGADGMLAHVLYAYQAFSDSEKEINDWAKPLLSSVLMSDSLKLGLTEGGDSWLFPAARDIVFDSNENSIRDVFGNVSELANDQDGKYAMGGGATLRVEIKNWHEISALEEDRYQGRAGGGRRLDEKDEAGLRKKMLGFRIIVEPRGLKQEMLLVLVREGNTAQLEKWHSVVTGSDRNRVASYLVKIYGNTRNIDKLASYLESKHEEPVNRSTEDDDQEFSAAFKGTVK